MAGEPEVPYPHDRTVLIGEEPEVGLEGGIDQTGKGADLVAKCETSAGSAVVWLTARVELGWYSFCWKQDGGE